jgi:hypothetical protein
MLLGSDNSIDPEDVRDELRTELLMLNAALKELNPNLDLSDALRPLLADTGPAVAHVQRLSRQKERMEKIRDGLLRQAEEKQSAARAESSACAMPAHPEPFGRHQEPQSSAPAETSSARARPCGRAGGRAGGRRASKTAQSLRGPTCVLVRPMLLGHRPLTMLQSGPDAGEGGAAARRGPAQRVGHRKS